MVRDVSQMDGCLNGRWKGDRLIMLALLQQTSGEDASTPVESLYWTSLTINIALGYGIST